VYYDALTLAAVKDELSRLLLGAHVQRIVQPSELSLGLEVYAGQRYQLLLSAESQTAGVFLMTAKLRRGREVPSPVQLLLLKYVRGARLEALEQPPFERVLRLSFSGEQGPIHLICEVMGRYSNVILVDQGGLILEAVKRVPPSRNRYRTILPQHPYVAPPAQKKEHPLALTPAALRAIVDRQPEASLWQCIVDGIAGISPILARELVYRAASEVEPKLPYGVSVYERLVVAIDELMHLPQTHAWAPCVAYEGEGEERHPVAYAPYALTHLPDHEAVASISAAIGQVLEAWQSFDAYKQVRQRLHGLINEQVDRQRARLASLQHALVPAAEVECVQFQASAILAMAWSIKPGQAELLVDPAQLGLEGDPASPGTMRIPLDPTLSPAENAQGLFHTYRKMQAAAAEVPQLISETEIELAYLRQLDTEVELAENRLQLDEIEQELRAAGHVASRGKEARPSGKSQPLSVRSGDGTLILVGRNSLQNDEVTFRRGTPDDMWLHAHGVPGAHVIIKCGGTAVDEETLLLGARLAAYYSASRHEPRVQVDFTVRRHIRHVKGGRPGMVTYTHEQTLVVVPEVSDLADDG
jgi:predicted ribosome quality control (RQC) complex YloA/Tae2 family protein